MKKVLFYLIAMCSFVATSCSSDDDGNPAEIAELNFNQVRYSLARGEVELKLISDKPASTTVSIPVSFSGTAVEGTDFTADKVITLKAGETEAILIVKRIDENIGEEDKELVVNLGTAPTGFKLGVGNYTAVELLGNAGVIMSFDNTTDILSLSGIYYVSLQKMTGGNYKVPAALKLDVEVAPSSTAVEGTHFEFAEGKYAIFNANKNQGSVAIKFLKKEIGKDKLVLRLSQKDGFAYGNNATITITINGANQLTGTWQFDKFANQEWLKSSYPPDYGSGYYDEETFPKASSSDKITFTGNSYEEYTFTPNLVGDLKNYFNKECKATFEKEENKVFQELGYPKVEKRVAVYNFASVNVNFSASSKKERSAKVSFRVTTIDNQEVLECTLDDYEPTDFFTGIYEFEQNMADYAPLRIYFKAVK